MGRKRNLVRVRLLEADVIAVQVECVHLRGLIQQTNGDLARLRDEIAAQRVRDARTGYLA